MLFPPCQKTIFVFIAIITLLWILPIPLQGQGVIKVPINPSQFTGWLPGHLVVRLDSLLMVIIDKTAAARTGLTGIERLDQLGRQLQVKSLVQQFPLARKCYYQDRLIDLSGWFRVTFNNLIAVENVRDLYARIPGVSEVQPIGIHSVDRIPNDGFFTQQWHLRQSADHDIDAPEAWDYYTGNPEIIVGVLDSGVRYYHKDLGGATASYNSPLNSRGNMWINAGELTGGVGNGIDDDGNDYIDDWIGWDFVTGVTGGGGYLLVSGEDYNTPDNNPSDFNGHGTHCAGNVSAINNNGYATAAAAGGWGNGTQQINANGVRVMALRIGYSMTYRGQEYGFVQMDFAAQALQYAADNGARIVSCSWGSSNSGGIAAAIDYFLAAGGLIFKAAGNDGNSTADYICNRGDANIISVAATDSNDLKASFSNYGTWVDISAPGVDILSSYHVHSDPQNDYVATISGTSMSTPITASAAALIWSANPSLSTELVRQILFNGAENIDALNPSYAGLLGVGRVNAFRPLQDPSLPVELETFTARHDSGAVILEWETFSETNNLGFEIFRGIDGDSTSNLIASYRELISLQGAGNSSMGHLYRYIDGETKPGFVYRYFLYDVDYYGQHTAHGPVLVDLRDKNSEYPANGGSSSDHLLFVNFPNPFNSSTTIKFTLPRTEHVELKVFNILGKEVLTLVSGQLDQGIHTYHLEAGNLASGIYYYSLRAGEFEQVRKMILLR